MTQQEWIIDTNRMLASLNDAKFMMPVIQVTHNQQVQRLFGKGISGDGDKIGYYSTAKTGIYINPKYNIGSFPGEGKNGEKVFKKTGEPHKTKYFENYKAYRSAISKETSFVNLRLTENLKIDYSNSLRFSNGTVTSSVNSQENVGKLDGAIERYGDETFDLTLKEKEELSERFSLLILKNLRRD